MLVPPADPYRPVTTNGGLADRDAAYRSAYRSCVATFEQIAEWKRKATTPVPVPSPLKPAAVTVETK